ncbi:MAG: ABC transporter substrate-binding protein [Oscillatoria sp. PMC 1068.18]|nr:ABC transporter substrate-binding protein [Oscillatoria sp. PMC 1076.18]MEC4990746.1 ABC transporter substrate-binding protein [Oscillatoria sp. PMC 1068.18]
MKSLLSRLLAIVLSFTLLFITGCQTNSATDSEIIKITMWHGINPPANRDVFNQLVTKFNQNHPQIELEALYIGQPDGQLPKILTAVVGNVPPDILWFTPQLTGQLVELQAIKPLESWLNNSPLKQEIDSVLLESMELDNHFWSIPLATNNTAIFYRPSLFKKVGISELPQTWQQLRETAEKLTQDFNKDGLIDQYGLFLSLGKGEWTVFAWLPFVFSAGGELTLGNQPNLVNKGTIAALEFGADLVADKLAILSAPERGYEMDNFISGKAAMQITGPWTLGQLQQSNLDYGVFPIPAQKERAAVVGGENLFVFKTTPEREQAAIEFLSYVLSEEFQTAWALGTGYLPINKKAQTSTEYQKFVQENPMLNIFLQQMEWARSRPIIPGYSRLSENFGRAIEASLLGKQSPEEALAASQKRLELIFQDKY